MTDDDVGEVEWPAEEIPVPVDTPGAGPVVELDRGTAAGMVRDAAAVEWYEHLRMAIDGEHRWPLRIGRQEYSVVPMDVVTELGKPYVLYRHADPASPARELNDGEEVGPDVGPVPLLFQNSMWALWALDMPDFRAAARPGRPDMWCRYPRQRRLPERAVNFRLFRAGTVTFVHEASRSLQLTLEPHFTVCHMAGDRVWWLVYDAAEGDGFVLSYTSLYEPHAFGHHVPREAPRSSAFEETAAHVRQAVGEYKTDAFPYGRSNLLVNGVDVYVWAADHLTVNYPAPEGGVQRFGIRKGVPPSGPLPQTRWCHYLTYPAPPHTLVFSLRGLGLRHTRETTLRRLLGIANSIVVTT